MVLQGHAAADQLLPRVDEGATLAHLFAGDGHGGELSQGVDFGQSAGVVAVGLAFEMLELPGFAAGVGDQAGDAELGTQVADPSGQETGLDEDDSGFVLGDKPGQFIAAGREGGEAVVLGGAIDAGDALVLAEVEGENRVGGRGRGGGGRGGRDRGVHGKLLWGEG